MVDIKPGNLLLGCDGLVKITDSDLARGGVRAGTGTGLLIGTAAYLAPERVGVRGAIRRATYSLGVVAYECLAGVPPFSGTLVEIALAHRDRPAAALRPPCQRTWLRWSASSPPRTQPRGRAAPVRWPAGLPGCATA